MVLRIVTETPTPEQGAAVSRPAFDALDRHWTAFTHSREATDALARWHHDRHLRASDLNTLVQGIWAADKADAEAGCAALARLAPTDPAAARVLLQVLRPGLRTLGRRLALGGSFDHVDQELLALAWERIRTYPIDRRPAKIAADILLDVRKAYVGGILGPEYRTVPIEEVPPGRQPAAPSVEHEAIDAHLPSLHRAHRRLTAAIGRGTITPRTAAVVWRTRVEQHDDAAVADELGVEVRTLQRRRQRAERRLAKAS